MKITTDEFQQMKGAQLICALTCYDTQMAAWLNESNLHFILVGDSVIEVLYGQTSTRGASVEIMANHVKAVAKGAPNKHIMADMPSKSYNTPNIALKNAKKFMQCGASSVKLENPKSSVVEALVSKDIPVCGHIGLTPQTASKYTKKGTTSEEASAIIRDARRLVKSGIFLLLLEAVKPAVSKEITKSIAVPTIGIASGENKKCVDGKILVLYDLLGLTKKLPPFIKKHENFGENLLSAVNRYCNA